MTITLDRDDIVRAVEARLLKKGIEIKQVLTDDDICFEVNEGHGSIVGVKVDFITVNVRD